jgi:membrane protease YdiL (CAAX protease family)
MIVAAFLMLIYLATFETTTIILFPSILLIGGLTMEMFLERKREVTDDDATVKSLGKIGYFSVIALFGIFLVGYTVNLFPLITLQLTSYSALVYSVLIAVSEEVFFRGFVTDWLLVNMKKTYLALVASAAVFCAYHLARYGTNVNALAYVFFGGFILSWVAYKSKRISPTLIAHVINNAATYMAAVVAFGMVLHL